MSGDKCQTLHELLLLHLSIIAIVISCFIRQLVLVTQITYSLIDLFLFHKKNTFVVGTKR